MDTRVLTNAISVVLYGGTFVPTEFIGATERTPDAGSDGRDGGDPEAFSEREITMLRMIADGSSNKEIARSLNLQEVTVKFYLTRLFARLHVKNRAQAAVEAVRLKILGEN